VSEPTAIKDLLSDDLYGPFADIAFSQPKMPNEAVDSFDFA